MQYVNVVLQNPLFRGAVSGLLAAAVVDFHAFLTWKSAHDVATYDWGTATFRWAQGAVAGAFAAAGLFVTS
jgi:hypothetical protein